MISSKSKQIFSSHLDPFCNMQKPPPLKSSSFSLQDARLLVLPYQTSALCLKTVHGRKEGKYQAKHKLKAALSKLLERRNTEMMEFPSHLFKKKKVPLKRAWSCDKFHSQAQNSGLAGYTVHRLLALTHKISLSKQKLKMLSKVISNCND